MNACLQPRRSIPTLKARFRRRVCAADLSALRCMLPYACLLFAAGTDSAAATYK